MIFPLVQIVMTLVHILVKCQGNVVLLKAIYISVLYIKYIYTLYCKVIHIKNVYIIVLYFLPRA